MKPLLLAITAALLSGAHADDIYLKKSIGHGQFSFTLIYRIDNKKNYKQRTVVFTTPQACLREYQRIRQGNALHIFRMKLRGEK